MAVTKKAVKKSAAKAVSPAAKPTVKATSPTVSYIPESVAKFAVPMAGLTPKKNNPRKHDVAKLVELIKQHGFRIPIIIDRDGVIQSGNGRYKAARELGMKSIPAIRQDFLSKESAEAFSIIENKSHEWSSWDDEVLQRILSSKAMVRSIEQTGFTKNEISKIKLRATETLTAGLNLGWLVASALKSSLSVLHYAVVRSGMLCITNLDTYAQVKVDAPDGTVFDLERYRSAGDLSKAIVADGAGALADFPPEPQRGKAGLVTLPEKCLGDAFMAEFISHDITHSSLQGVCIDGKSKIVFATDGHFGVSRSAPAGDYSLSIPPEVWRSLSNVKAEHVVSADRLFSSGEGWEMSTRIQCDLPRYSSVIPPQKNVEVFDVREVLDAVRALVPVVSGANHMVVFVNGSVRTAGAALPAQYDVALDCPIRGAFNAVALEKILSSVAKVSGGEPCKYWMGDSDISGRCVSAGEYLFLIMPLRMLDETDENVVYERLQSDGKKRGKTCTLRIDTPLGSVNIGVELGVGVAVETVRNRVLHGSFSGEVV